MTNWKTVSLVPAFLLMGIGIVGGGDALLAAPAQPTTTSPQRSFTDGENNTYTIGPDGRLVKQAAPVMTDAPVFTAFSTWMEKYQAAPAQQKASLEAEGVRLATERREAMAELIPQNPKRALELSIGIHERQGLPTSVVQQLEDILQGRANYDVIHATIAVKTPDKPEEKHTHHNGYSRFLNFGSQTYSVYVYGRRVGLMTKDKLPIYGIAVDKVAAIHESPIWVLAPGQKPPAGATLTKNGTKCPVCGKEAANGIVGVVGSSIYYFDTQADLAKFTESLWAAEDVIGPDAHG